MDTKLTLSFDEDIINKAKSFAERNNISLSRMIEHLLAKVVEKPYQSLEDFPISEWVSMVAEGDAIYQSKKAKKSSHSDEFFASKK
jgi:antitoxin component of RelBE/YafQ-DinJ toxin-antitoxin module